MNKGKKIWLNWKSFGDALGIFVLGFIGLFVIIFCLFLYQFQYFYCVPVAPFAYPYEMLTIGFLIITIVLLYIAINWFKRKDHLRASSLALIGLIFMSLSVLSGYSAFISEPNYMEFNQQEWKRLDKKPLPMIRTLIKKDAFIGLTKEELEITYGSVSPNSNKFIYRTSDFFTYLEFAFDNDTISAAYLHCIN